MSKQVINRGTTAGDKTGESLFSAFGKANENFTELYGAKTEFVANAAALPATGEALKLYIALDTSAIYRWTGSAYVESLTARFNLARTGLVDPEGKLRKIHRADQPKLFRAAAHPLTSLSLNPPVFAVGNSTKVYGLLGSGADIGKSFTFDHATGTLTKSAATISGGAGTSINGLWKSSGAVFAACLPAAATHQKVYRSVDGLTGWTAVIDFSTFPNANPAGGDVPKQYAEASNGNLFIAVYNAQNGNGDAYNKLLLKSTDAGVTWTDISANLGEGIALRHTHAVVWDKYRNLLWVCCGDAGDVPSVSVSSDYGVTFTVLPSSFQATGIIPTPDSIYLLSDRQAVGTPDTGIWRLQCANINDALVNPFIRVYDPMRDSGIEYQSTNGAGFAWWGWYDEETGVIYAPYVETTQRVRSWAADGASPSYTEAFAALVASSDGWNFGVIATEVKTSATVSFARQEQSSRPNDYADWDGWHWLAGADSLVAPWRVVPGDYEFALAPTSATGFGNGSASRPMKTPLAQRMEMTLSSSDWFHQMHKYRLTENTDQPIYLPSTQYVLNRNGFDSSYAGVALAESQGFEQVGNVAPSASWITSLSGAGALTWNSTTQKRGGAQSVLLATTNTADIATARFNHAAMAEGGWAVYEGWFYVDLAAMTAGSIILMKGHGGAAVKLIGSSVGPYLQGLYSPSGIGVDQNSFANGRVPFPLKKWVKVTLRFRNSYNAGSAVSQSGVLEVYQDDALLCGATGGMQTGNRADPSYVQMGIVALTTLTAVNVYLDDVKVVLGQGGALPGQVAGVVAGGKYSRVYG